jgi:site-specific DNA-methyltransferase (adenine-specific)
VNDNTIDICITSPPYNIGKIYNTYNDTRSNYIKWLSDVFKETCRVLKPTGHLFLNISPTRDNPFLPWEVANTIPWKVQNPIVWAKAIEIDNQIHGRSSVHLYTNRYLCRGWEMMWHFTECGNTPIDREKSGVPYRQEWAEDNFNRTGRTARPTTDCWHIGYETTGYMGQDSRKLKGNKKHPAIFPADLVRKCLKVAGCNSSHIVFDPFAGTGTTLVVAKEFGASGIGCEIDEDYVAFIKERMSSYITS